MFAWNFERRPKDAWKMSLGDVHIMIFYGLPSRERQFNALCDISKTVTFLKYSFSVPVSASVLNIIKKTHYFWIIFDPTHQMCCVKHLKVSRCLFLKFGETSFSKRTFSKRPRKTSVGCPSTTIQFWTSHTNAFSLRHFQFCFTKCRPEILKS